MPLSSYFCNFRKSLHDTLSSVGDLSSYNTAIESIIEAGIPDTPIVVPVVFHILASSSKTDLESFNINNILQGLNRSFEGSKIEFVLTIKNSDGEFILEPGINRVDGALIAQTRYNPITNQAVLYRYVLDGVAVKNIGDDGLFCPGVLVDYIFSTFSWDPYKVFNIFLVESLNNTFIYADQTCVMHSSSPVIHEVNGTENQYGVMVPMYSLGDSSSIGYDYSSVPTINNLSVFVNSLGRTLAHAMGHSLGLLEISHTGINRSGGYINECSDGCGYNSTESSGDCCSDTEIQSPAQSSEDLQGSTNTCTSESLDVSNIMRFSLNSVDELVSSMFTTMQKRRMEAGFYTIVGEIPGILNSIITYYTTLLEEIIEEEEDLPCSNIINEDNRRLSINLSREYKEDISNIFINKSRKFNRISKSINRLYNKFK